MCRTLLVQAPFFRTLLPLSCQIRTEEFQDFFALAPECRCRYVDLSRIPFTGMAPSMRESKPVLSSRVAVPLVIIQDQLDREH